MMRIFVIGNLSPGVPIYEKGVGGPLTLPILRMYGWDPLSFWCIGGVKVSKLFSAIRV